MISENEIHHLSMSGPSGKVVYESVFFGRTDDAYWEWFASLPVEIRSRGIGGRVAIAIPPGSEIISTL
jgi:hypothetical protein